MSLNKLIKSVTAKNPKIKIDLNGCTENNRINIKDEKEGRNVEMYQFNKNDDIVGNVNIEVFDKIDHNGITIELVGTIIFLYEANLNSDFISLKKELDTPGTLKESKTIPFEFKNIEKNFESYNGKNFKLKYLIRVTINRNQFQSIMKEHEFLVYMFENEILDRENKVLMDVGIEGALHIVFEQEKGIFHLKDCVVGKVEFRDIKIRLKTMELTIVKKETAGTGQQSNTEESTISKFEVMDGGPVKGEVIPIRFYLKGQDLTPTQYGVNSKFSVGYYINLVLIDEEERRYFKQQEIRMQRLKV